MKKYIGAALLGGLVIAFPSCSDTWDEHYGDGETFNSSATESLWDIISRTNNLGRFREIAEAASYYRDEDHPQKDYTFKDLLQSTTTLTVWAPEDDAFTEDEYKQWLSWAKEKGSRGYAVQQQLLGNSIALWRQVATSEKVDTMTMLNGKRLVFDKKAFTMQGIQLDGKNIPATNGILHTLPATIPFKYNLYQYLKDGDNTTANQLNSMHGFITENDTTYFNENGSVEGSPDADGNPTYVDSVYITTNTLFYGTHRFPTQNNTEQYLVYNEGFGANIDSEDSTFIMLLPTDNAWKNAYQKLEKYYNYATQYIDMEKFKSDGGNSPKASQMLPQEGVINTDSLKDKCIRMDIASPLCFNLHQQPNADGKIGRWKLDEFLADGGNTPKYLLNTFGDTLRTDLEWDKSSILKGEKAEVSNGMGIIKSEWDIPAKLYKPDIIIEINSGSFYDRKSTGTKRYVSFSNASAGEWIDSCGRVTHDNFYYFMPQSTSNPPSFEFKLRGNEGENYESEVMSGKYDIYVVMVPNYYLTSTDSIVLTTTEGGSGVIITDKNAENYEDTVPAKHKIVGTLSYRGIKSGKEANISSEKSGTKEYDGTKIKEVLLFEDFEFPFSYKNLIRSFPTLKIESKTDSKDRKNGYSDYLCIDRIILRSKD